MGVERNNVGETSLKVSTRITQYQKFADEKWDTTGVSYHASTCKVGFFWTETKLLTKKLERKVREALEIQLQKTSPHSYQSLNQDDGQNVMINLWKPTLAHMRSKSL